MDFQALQCELRRMADVTRGLAAVGAAEKGERLTDAEYIGNGFARIDLNRLMQNAQGAVDGDRARVRAQLTGDQLEERGLPGAVAANKPRPYRSETQLEIGKEGTAVRRGP